jgi:TDG/mug DNA glycosylase family protein
VTAAVSRPSRAQLEAAHGQRVPDLIAPGLRVLFCGINPSLYSVVVGHHFARPGNRFWPTLHQAGFTPRRLVPSEERELLARGIGITNVCSEASASADSLTPADYAAGAAQLRRKLHRYKPRVIAFLGLGAYRIAAREPGAGVGPQPVPFAGVTAWALPNPSGLNAHYQLPELVACYRALAQTVFGSSSRGVVGAPAR